MSDTRTGDRTPSLKRRHSTGQRDVGNAKNLDNTGLSRKRRWDARSESSAGRGEHSEASLSHWKRHHQFMTNVPNYHHDKAEHQTSRAAFWVSSSGQRELDTSHAGSWCESE